MKEEKIFFSGGQDLCVWNEKGELIHKCDRASEHCKYILNFEILLELFSQWTMSLFCPVIYIIIIISAI